MRSINILPPEVIAKIAAGEVIERPASVVKELLENSLDAGADRISVALEKSGKRLIRVADNGVGMSKEDLSLCIKRHATSKIYTLKDLFCVKTLGFRGEALPSIASVSKVKITSKPHDHLFGHKLVVEAGKDLYLEETGAPSGTTVEVRDLFFNVPARRKFLKSDRTELGYVMDVFIKIALAHLNVHFSLEHNNKLLLNLPATEDPVSRFCLVFGEGLSESMKAGKKIGKDIFVAAYISDKTRRKSDRLFFYVNSRNIKDRLLLKTVLDACSERFVKGEYPQGMVFLNLNPKMVDVNVHPTKQEVRFQNESEVYGCVFECIKELFSFSRGKPSLKIQIQKKKEKDKDTVLKRDIASEKNAVSEEEKQYLISEFKLKKPHIIGQLRKTYIICEDEQGLVLIDQHAAHERILYEKLKNGFNSGEFSSVSQKLLEPYRIELSSEDTRNLNNKIDLLLNMGIEISHFGGNTFLITSFPPILKNINWDSFFSEILEENTEKIDSIEHLLKTMACHGAIKAGDLLSLEEMDALLKELYETELPYFCPHGRPVIKTISFQELEKMFKR